MKDYKYLIVGGGMTADAAVKGIRAVDAAGSIGILTAEVDPPYKRPPLSKGLWTKGKSIDDIWCATEAKGAEVLRDLRAVSLDPRSREVADDKGTVYRYEKLLLAMGAAPKKLPFGDSYVIYYRTCADYRRLRAMTEGGQHFAVIGAGFIGSEIAAALAINDRDVTMIFPEAAVGALMLPLAFARSISAHYESKGVSIIAGRKCSGIEVGEGVYKVHLENGRTVSVDGIVAGLGVTPNTELAEAAGLEVRDGIVVDDRLRTKQPHVYAAGDVANFYNPVLDRRMRVEHEDNALTMGERAGRNMAGEEQPYLHLPYFYSDLFDLGYEAVGETDSRLEVFTELSDPSEKGPLFYLKDGRVRGVVFWNTFGKVDAGRELIAAPGPHTRESLRAWAKERLAD